MRWRARACPAAVSSVEGAVARVGLAMTVAGALTLTYATSSGSSGYVRAAKKGEGPGAKLDAA
jgi:hypothetical protein